MRRDGRRSGWWQAGLALGLWSLSAQASTNVDVDGNGYIGRVEAAAFAECLGGPNEAAPAPQCLDSFDADGDGDVDLVDFTAFIQLLGHTPVPLRDVLGNPITVTSTAPHSPRKTCGECHDHEAEAVANGEWFQQGRADLDGNVDMRDDYFGDGRHWIKSAGRYGKWGQSFQYLLAAKDNTDPSRIDQTTFAWVRDCGGCHSGGGPGERDRDDQLIYDQATGELGYELLGKTPAEVALDGDYSVQDYATGSVSLAPWDVTGVAEPDCLLCHRDYRPTVDGADMVQAWRRSTLAAGATLVDGQGRPVPAFAAAPTAGQGWFSSPSKAASLGRSPLGGPLAPADAALLAGWSSDPAKRSTSSALQIDYSAGVIDGSLMVAGDDQVYLSPNALVLSPRDTACVSCHPLAVVAGMTWFDERDVLYRKFTKGNDEDPHNDIPPELATVCVECHPAGLDHNQAKGNSFQLQYRNELDYVGFRSCRDCHLTRLPGGEPNPHKHPDAPDVPGTTVAHIAGAMIDTLSCQACHIPYALVPGLVFRDITMPGSVGWTSQYYSADPLDPSDSDKSRWYPALRWKRDSDGVMRVFPASVWINIYFGDWHQNGTPEDLSDDIIAPIYTWRVAQVVGGSPLPVVTDDDGDGRLEINRPQELLAYFEVLEGNDANGRPVAAKPVLVRGHRVWYEDPAAPDGVSSFEHEGTGIPITPYPYIWGLDHNVLAKEESWGADPDDPYRGCVDCHRESSRDSPVFDRLILIDPDDPVEGAVYETVRDQLGLSPPWKSVVRWGDAAP